MNENNTANTSKTDWARVDAMTDDEIDTSDSPELTEQFFKRAKRWSPPQGKSQVSVMVDAETLAWFEGQGESAEQHLAAALRIYAEAQKYAAGRSR
ncbi:MAG: hypothetical protein VKJ24_02425 [Synechococcales bacterium]|nr:hypothetical protein [Synechococcales bacterium]